MSLATSRRPRPDLIVFDSMGERVAVIEIKPASRTDADWAATFRSALLDHRATLDAPYFLLIAADNVYLWEGENLPKQSPGERRPPSAVVSVSDLLGEYFRRAGVTARIEATLELIVAEWLWDLTGATSRVAAGAVNGPSPVWRRFAEAVRAGSVEFGDGE